MFKGNQYKLASVGNLHARKTETFQSQLLKKATFCVTVGQDMSGFRPSLMKCAVALRNMKTIRKIYGGGPGLRMEHTCTTGATYI